MFFKVLYLIAHVLESVQFPLLCVADRSENLGQSQLFVQLILPDVAIKLI